MSSSPWWYGVIPFPVVILTALTSRFASRAFFAAARAPYDSAIGEDVAWFVLDMLSFWTGILVAAVVLVCLLADVRSLRGDEAWSPSTLWGLAGVVHLGGAVFAELLIVSVPALSYYLYRRHDRVGRS